MTRRKRSRRIAGLGDSVPGPLGFNAFAPEWLFYTEGTCTEGRAPQGCDPSADARAGMARGGLIGRPKLKTQTLSNISLLQTKNGLDNGVHFIPCVCVSRVSAIQPSRWIFAA
jgi:hypothetical protein